MSVQQEILYWLWFSLCLPMTHYQKASLWQACQDIELIYRGDGDWYMQYGVPRKALAALENKDTAVAESIFKRCQRQNIGILPFNDERYPDALNNIPDPPIVLYVKGTLPALQPSLAVVGTREPDKFGEYQAEAFAYDLARCGMLIVSGMARGIDSAAHRGALRAGKPTVAVLGCGVDVVYPKSKESSELYDKILEAGAVVSEYPPGTGVRKEYFPMRNRIISGMCDGTFVIQGGVRSGASITANRASNQNRSVFALPGRHDDPLAKCPNTLIKKQVAKLIDSIDDIFEDIPGTARPPKETPPVLRTTSPVMGGDLIPAPTIDLTQFESGEREVLEFISVRERTMEQLAAHFDMPINVLLSHLTMLETYGVIVDRGGKTYSIMHNS